MEALQGEQVKLRSGMVLEGNSHSVEIPDFDNEAIQDLNEEFGENYDTAVTDTETAKSITEYVHQKLDYENPMEMFDPDTGEQIEEPVDLGFSAKYRSGRCKEQAALAYMLMRLNGVDTAYVKGGYPVWNDEEEEFTYGKHAWLKVDSEEGTFFADPTNNHFGPYEEFTDDYNELGVFEAPQEVSVGCEGQRDAVGHFF